MNYINSEWRSSGAADYLDVVNPATAEILGKVPLSPGSEVHEAAKLASESFEGWRRTPAPSRIQYLFKMKELLEENFEEISRAITMECGKTMGESRGEMRRAIENVEVACGIPAMMMGDFSEDIAGGIDEIMIWQPVGVCAIFSPFNFPGMIPFWFSPYTIAAGYTVIVKPSKKVPLTMVKVFELLEQLDLPPGVVNMVNGGKETVDAILEHPAIRATSFVGSTAVAKYIYSQGAANGKRVQAQGGAKNPVIILPDADMDMTARITADSAFGCAGQRCLAASVAITFGDARHTYTEAIADAAVSRVMGYGLDEAVQMGPVINVPSMDRIESLIQKGADEGATMLVDGRSASVSDYENGSLCLCLCLIRNQT